MPRDDVTGKTAASAEKAKKKHVLRETVEAIVIALVVALLIRTFVVQAFKIPSSSMEDTLLIGDHILVSKFSYGIQVPRPAVISVLGVPVPFFETELKPVWGGIERGDVVVFRFPGDRTKDYIKRVVGLAGDTVEVRKKRVYINGSPMDDPHAVYKGGIETGSEYADNFGPYTVPEGNVFVMGDNRDRSYDSRFWGPVSFRDIRGRAFIIYFSWNTDSRWVRFGRVAKIIH
ncbi:MAG: signal peptidase I [Deltaproteobacteria bacterium]|nr:signal peptidase I [Deltaproteobacteria bacterium]